MTKIVGFYNIHLRDQQNRTSCRYGHANPLFGPVKIPLYQTKWDNNTSMDDINSGSLTLARSKLCDYTLHQFSIFAQQNRHLINLINIWPIFRPWSCYVCYLNLDWQWAMMELLILTHDAVFLGFFSSLLGLLLIKEGASITSNTAGYSD